MAKSCASVTAIAPRKIGAASVIDRVVRHGHTGSFGAGLVAPLFLNF
jgi:hypothetical protein